MKKLYIAFLLSLGCASTAWAQWSPVSSPSSSRRTEISSKKHYSLDIEQLRMQLKDVAKMGKGSRGTIISVPTLHGGIERFQVYSLPVLEEALAEQYQLGSYSGVGIDDPTKTIRFSVAPNDFQSMIMKGNELEFIEPQSKDKKVYAVFPKSPKSASKTERFECKTHGSFGDGTKNRLSTTKTTAFDSKTQSTLSNDRNFRNYRLAISVNGEYTALFNGVAGALAQINATMTRVNGVFERDFAIHMTVQNFPQLIFTNPATDPYSNLSNGNAPDAWNLELQQTLTNTIGNGAYDIGHFFGHRGGGGFAGDVGNVCRNPVNINDGTSKGAAITSPLIDDQPYGDTFDIDFVAHEMGHQFGAWHTFSHEIHRGSVAHMEPGSGSTIMGYAGITNSDVQDHSDAYFHAISIDQVQNYVSSQTCGALTPITNTPPQVAALPTKTIPKGTAFALTATASDAEGNPLTYTWEQFDATPTPVTDVTVNNTRGPKFRSIQGTGNPTRYFPKQDLVLKGILESRSDWESVSNVARDMNFRVTVRDNNPNAFQQQTNFANQKITVGSDGPFTVDTKFVYTNNPTKIVWTVANTTAAPYNVANVKIDYSLDNGTSWITALASTPNTGSANFSFQNISVNQPLHVRASAIDNVFYAVSLATSKIMQVCNGTPPETVSASEITNNSARISWVEVQNATYTLNYRKSGSSNWTAVPNISSLTYTISGLDEGTLYEYQVNTVCSGSPGSFSPVQLFRTVGLRYCSISSANYQDEFISQVQVISEDGSSVMINNSAGSNYTDYSNDLTKEIKLIKGSTSNTISVSKQWTGGIYKEGITVWIDFNRNGIFEVGEMIMNTNPSTITPEKVTFAVPTSAYADGKATKMRVVLRYNANQADPCQNFNDGEVEDYNVVINNSLSVDDTALENGIRVFPNPASEMLFVAGLKSERKYQIYTMTGQLVTQGKTNREIKINNLPKGVYVLVVDNDQQKIQTKFIKK